MCKNFIALTLRSTKTNKTIKLINMAFLAIGLACFITWNCLQDFPYYLDFRSLFSVFAALLVMITALTTIRVTSINAAGIHPALGLQLKTREE